jgi:hypothetical protein
MLLRESTLIKCFVGVNIHNQSKSLLDSALSHQQKLYFELTLYT